MSSMPASLRHSFLSVWLKGTLGLALCAGVAGAVGTKLRAGSVRV